MGGGAIPLPSPNMVTLIFKLLLLISPILIGANVNQDMLDMIFFRTGIIVLFMASFLDKPKREIPKEIIYLILGLLGLCLVNVFIHNFKPTVLMNFQNLFLGVLGFCILYRYLDENQNLIKYVLWAALINLIFFISQSIGFDPVFDKRPDITEVGGLIGNKTRLMTYFALITSFLWTPLLIVSAIMGLYTHQIIVFIPIAICLWVKRKNKREHIELWIAVLLGLFLFRNNIFQSLVCRFDMAWKPALLVFFKQPLIGLGLSQRGIDLEFLANSYLQFIVGVGILGAVWLGYVFKFLFKALYRNKESVALASLALIMFVEYPIEIPRLWFTIIFILVMFLIKKKEAIC